MIAKDHPAYVYAKDVLAGKIRAPKYVILQCSEFVFIARGKSERYVLDTDRLQKIENLLGLMVMAKGLKARTPVKEALAGFQWLFIAAVLCVVWRANRERRRYQTAILAPGRTQLKSPFGSGLRSSSK